MIRELRVMRSKGYDLCENLMALKEHFWKVKVIATSSIADRCSQETTTSRRLHSRTLSSKDNF